MIARLSGIVVDREDKSLVVEAGGVGYRVAVLSNLQNKVAEGDEVSLRTYHHVTSDAQQLFGFLKQEDLRYFQLLLTVPSVGPRTAMNILDVAPPRTLAQAVSDRDITLLTKVSGVGRKTAERILIELEGKITLGEQGAGVSGGVQHEAITALVSIGFSSAQAREAVSKLPKQVTTVEEAIKYALKEKV